METTTKETLNSRQRSLRARQSISEFGDAIRFSPWALAFGLCSLFGVLTCLGWQVFQHPNFEGDTYALVRGATSALGCIKHGQWRSCTGVEPFPPLQYLVALPLVSLGIAEANILKVLLGINAIAFLATASLLFWGVRKHIGNTAAMLVSLVWFGSYAVWFSSSTFSELFASLLCLTMVVVVRKSTSTLWTAAAVFGAGLTKDFAPPLAFLLALASIPLFRNDTLARLWLRERQRIVAITLAAAASLAVIHLFNQFRYGVWINLAQIGPIVLAPSVKQYALNWLGIWFSPGGGLFFFATGIAIILAISLLLGIRRLIKNGVSVIGIAALIPSLVFLMANAVTASWYTPLGWISWGPRLLLPWAAACACLATNKIDRKHWINFEAALKPTWAAIAVGLVWWATTLPNFFSRIFPGPLSAFFYSNSCGSAAIQQGHTIFYRMLNCYMFQTKPWLIAEQWTGLWTWPKAGFALLWMTLGASWILLRRRPKVASLN